MPIKKHNQQPKKIKIQSEVSQSFDYPIFCFRYLQSKPQSDYKFYADFIVRLQKISNLTWEKINTTQRHGFGTEKIPVEQIKPQLPAFVSPDVRHLTVFRASGDNRPFLGLRNGSVFHIIFIEEKFGDVYAHD